MALLESNLLKVIVLLLFIFLIVLLNLYFKLKAKRINKASNVPTQSKKKDEEKSKNKEKSEPKEKKKVINKLLSTRKHIREEDELNESRKVTVNDEQVYAYFNDPKADHNFKKYILNRLNQLSSESKYYSIPVIASELDLSLRAYLSYILKINRDSQSLQELSNTLTEALDRVNLKRSEQLILKRLYAVVNKLQRMKYSDIEHPRQHIEEMISKTQSVITDL